MIYPMVPFTMTLSDPLARFEGHRVTAVDVICAQLTRDVFAIAKFLFHTKQYNNIPTWTPILRASNETIQIFNQYLALSRKRYKIEP